MRINSKPSTLTLFLLLMLAASKLWAQAGPPFQTDDPTPVALGHYEAYIFGGVGGTPVEIDPIGPAFEFNWGAVANVQLDRKSTRLNSSHLGISYAVFC